MARSSAWRRMIGDHLRVEVTDDSGFLAIVDPDAYESFVDEDWELDALVAHFLAQMRANRLLLWGTGREDMWLVDVRSKPASDPGYRELTGPARGGGERSRDRC